MGAHLCATIGGAHVAVAHEVGERCLEERTEVGVHRVELEDRHLPLGKELVHHVERADGGHVAGAQHHRDARRESMGARVGAVERGGPAGERLARDARREPRLATHAGE